MDISRKRKVLILGDFNINPYEDAMTYLTGGNAVSSKNIAMKISRKDKKENMKEYFFYMLEIATPSLACLPGCYQ